MRLRIGKYDIPEHTLTNVDLTLGTSTVTFSGMAHEDEAREIVPKLRELAMQANRMHYEAVDKMGLSVTGLGNLVNLKLEEITTYPNFVIFSGELV
jgi:hypothetical protein